MLPGASAAQLAKAPVDSAWGSPRPQVITHEVIGPHPGPRVLPRSTAVGGVQYTGLPDSTQPRAFSEDRASSFPSSSWGCSSTPTVPATSSPAPRLRDMDN